jgi:DNA-directed RNA polymerase beta' subunit
VLPATLCYTSKHGDVVIRNGELIQGVITKNTISNRPQSIPHMIMRLYSVDVYIDFLTSCVRLANRWLLYRAFSVGLGDCIINTPESISDRVTENVVSLVKNISTLVKTGDANLIVLDRSEQTDNTVYFILNNSKEIGNKIIEDNMRADNNLKLLVESGSKGTYVNIMQITALMGQQIMNGKRIWPCYMKERALPCYLSINSSNIIGLSKTKARINERASHESNREAPPPPPRESPQFCNNIKSKHNKTQLKFPWTWNSMPAVNAKARPMITREYTHTDRRRYLNLSRKKVHPGGGAPHGKSSVFSSIKTYFESGGFITSSLLQGLNPQEFFFHAMGGRDGLLETSCKTAVTGYLERRLTKVCEDIQVDYNHNVVNTINGKCIQMNQQVDMFNTSMLWGSGANTRCMPGGVLAARPAPPQPPHAARV